MTKRDHPGATRPSAMKCAYHSGVNATTTCGGCKKPLCADCAGAAGCCAVCAARSAAEDLHQQDLGRAAEKGHREARQKTLARIRAGVLWGLLGLSIAAAAWQLPAAVRSLEQNKPLRTGTYHTNALADACITNLWTISRMLQEGKTPAASVTCPASALPYVSRMTPGGVVYHCPQPARHGLRSLQVSRVKPVPEVLK